MSKVRIDLANYARDVEFQETALLAYQSAKDLLKFAVGLESHIRSFLQSNQAGDNAEQYTFWRADDLEDGVFDYGYNVWEYYAVLAELWEDPRIEASFCEASMRPVRLKQRWRPGRRGWHSCFLEAVKEVGHYWVSLLAYDKLDPVERYRALYGEEEPPFTFATINQQRESIAKQVESEYPRIVTQFERSRHDWLAIEKEVQQVVGFIPPTMSIDPTSSVSFRAREYVVPRAPMVLESTQRAVELLEQGIRPGAVASRLGLTAANVRKIKQRYLEKDDAIDQSDA